MEEGRLFVVKLNLWLLFFELVIFGGILHIFEIFIINEV